MSKARLQEGHERHFALLDEATEATSRGDIESALDFCIEALSHLDSAMKFEKRWGDGELETFEALDFILDLAPFLLHDAAIQSCRDCTRSLRSLSTEQREQLIDRIEQAELSLAATHDLYGHLRGGETVENLDRDHVRIAERLHELGAVGFFDEDEPIAYLIADLNLPWRGKCSSCGALVRGAKHKFLETQRCPGCSSDCVFTITEPLPAFG